jgi:hypothetical protein
MLVSMVRYGLFVLMISGFLTLTGCQQAATQTITSIENDVIHRRCEQADAHLHQWLKYHTWDQPSRRLHLRVLLCQSHLEDAEKVLSVYQKLYAGDLSVATMQFEYAMALMHKRRGVWHRWMVDAYKRDISYTSTVLPLLNDIIINYPKAKEAPLARIWVVRIHHMNDDAWLYVASFYAAMRSCVPVCSSLNDVEHTTMMHNQRQKFQHLRATCSC